MRQMSRSSIPVGLLLSIVMAPAIAAGPARDAGPNSAGPVKLLTASWLGGPFDDEIVAAGIATDMSIVLAGNTVDLQLADIKPTVIGPAGSLDKGATPPPASKNKGNSVWRHPSTHGFIVRLSPEGHRVLSYTRFGYGTATIRKMCLDEKDNIFVLADAPGGIELNDGRAGRARSWPS
jgi:hypothetical protein